MLSFSTVKGIRIPEGDVVKITRVSDQTILWQAAYDAIVNGVSPLTLPSAVRAAVVYLKQQGVCEQNGTPTPTNPVDIKCNNGVIRIKDRELPYGYRRLLDIKFDGDFYYNTGEKLRGDDDVTITLKDTVTTGQNVFGCYAGTSAGTKNFSFFIYGNNSTSNSYLRYGETLYRPRFGSGERTVSFGKSGTTGFLTNVNITPEEFETTSVAYIGMLPNSSSPEFTGTIVGNALVSSRLKWIPCERMSDNTIGYYEFYTKRFIEKTGNGIPTTSGYDNTYYDELFVDGTSEIITLGQQNANAENLFAVGGYKDEQDIISGNIVRKTGIMILDGETELENGSGFSNDGRVHFYIGYSSILNNETRIASSTHFASTDIYGLSMPNNTIIGYFDSIKNYRIEIKNTNWTTLSDYVNFMKAQYEAGTPVIIIYPLADEITEQVTPQPLDTEEGDNVITVTAEVSNIPLEVKYKRT